MLFDVRTLSVVLVLVEFAAVGFSVILYASRQTFDGAQVWIAGQACMALGALGLLLRPVLPWLLALALANIPFLLASLLFMHSLYVFRGYGRFPRWAYFTVVIVVVLLSLDLSEDSRYRSIVFSSASAILSAVTAFVALYRQRTPYKLAATLLATVFVATGAANALRVFGLIGSEPAPLGEEGIIGRLFYMSSVLSAFLLLFGYYLLSSVRFEVERRAAEQRLRKQNLRLRSLNHTATTLISVIGHDVHTPIAGAARYVRRFLSAVPESIEQRREALEVIQETLEDSARLLENLILFGKERVSGTTTRLTDVSLREVVYRAVESLKGPLESKDIRLSYSFPERPRLVRSDQASLEVIVRNLISNAVKFSAHSAQVEVELREEDERTMLVIRDYGEGMPEHVQRSVMQLGDIITTQGTDGERGHGIGLALVRTLCTNLGIDLWFQSQPGEGTTVYLEFQDDSDTLHTEHQNTGGST